VITFSVCVSLIILVLIAAIFGLPSSDWVMPEDRDLYFPSFFKSEGFYRACLINLSFAGISTAAAAIQFVKYAAFWMICDPLLAILANLAFGLFAALSLGSRSSEIRNKKRWWWAISLLVIGFALFIFAVWTTVALSGTDAPAASLSATGKK
jgi:hypothetical protein